MFTLPEHMKVVAMNDIVTPDTLTTTDFICCKNAHRVWFVIHHYSAGGDTDYTVGLTEDTAVAAGTASPVVATFPIWSNIASGTASDTMTRRTDAASYIIDTGATLTYLVVLEWDPAKHTAGYDCIAVTGSGGNAANYVDVVAYIQERYSADQPPSAIID